MSILVVCTECGARLHAPDAAAGKTAPCPRCRAAITVPDSDPDALPEAVEEPTPVPITAPPTDITVEDDEDEPPVKGKRRRRGQRSSDRIQMAIGLALVLAALAVTVLMVVVVKPWERPVANADAVDAGPVTPRVPPAKAAPAVYTIDVDKLPAHRTAIRKHYLDTVLPVYDALHPEGAPGRDMGRRGLEAYGLYLAHRWRSDLLIEHVQREVDRGVQSGCTDPLLAYAASRLAVDATGSEDGWDKVVEIADRPELAKYPAVRRMHVLFNAAVGCLDAHSIPMKDRIERGKRLEQDFWKVFGDAAGDQNPHSEEEVLGVARLLVGREEALGGDRHANYRRARELFTAAGARESVRLTLDGVYHFHNAIVALGGNSALATRDQRDAAREHFELARTALEKAWNLDPKGRIPPTYMITVAFEIEQKWDAAEPWFVRAMEADPDNAMACADKVKCLSPQRGGTVEELLKFANWCLETGNWDGGIAQHSTAAYLAAGHEPRDFASSPDRWNEITKCFRAWLEAHPNSRMAMSRQARTAALTNHAGDAIPLFEKLGDRPWHGVFPDPTIYRRVVIQTYQSARQQPPRFAAAPTQDPPVIAMILRDKDRWEGPRAVRRDGFMKLAGEAYEQHHADTAKGHVEGVAALAAVAEAWSIGYPHGRHMDVAWVALDKAIAAGCDDPLIRSLHARFGLATGQVLPTDEVVGRYEKSLDALLASEYPAALKLPAQVEALLREVGTGDDAALEKRLDAFWRLFEKVAADRSQYAQRQLLQAAENLLEIEGVELLRHDAVHRKLKQALDEAKADPYTGLVIDGIHLTSAAWDARGGAPGALVAQDQMTIFKSRLTEAELALSRAWRLDPTRPEAPARMITVGMGLQHPRSEVDRWFARAVDADPADHSAYRRMALYLEPKWYGERMGMDLFFFRTLAFDCRRWKEGLGAIAYETEMLARVQYMGASLTNPGIWGEVEHTLKAWADAEPDCRYAKSVYALAAAQAGQFRTADRLFRELGEKPWPGVFPSHETYLRLAEAVANQVRGGKRVD